MIGSIGALVQVGLIRRMTRDGGRILAFAGLALTPVHAAYADSLEREFDRALGTEARPYQSPFTPVYPASPRSPASSLEAQLYAAAESDVRFG